jgi:SAM-dependent methyltransferase
MTYKDIDWNLLWQAARKEKTWRSKDADDWDRKADSFARRTAHSVYNTMFIDLLQPEQDWSVLDVGCGPGTISIPLAKRVRHVSALDFSPKMLAIIRERSLQEGIANISTHHLSWEDDWQAEGLAVHDVTIASRSLGVNDLRAALDKLNRFARKAAAVTDKVGEGPFDPDAFEAVGRKLETGPDYIYTVNMLYQMGINAKVDFIRLENAHIYSSMKEAVDHYIWMFKDLTAEEQKRLEDYVTTWAFLRWSPFHTDQ